MDAQEFEKVSRRYDPDLCTPFLSAAMEKEATIFVLWGNRRYRTRIRSVHLDSDPPQITLETFDPKEGNSLARDRREVGARFHFIREGSMYIVRFKLLLDGVKTEAQKPVVPATPPLDLKFITQSYTARPTPNLPLFVKFRLKGRGIHIGVRAVSMSGLVLEPHLATNSLSELEQINRLTVQFRGGKEIEVPGTFRDVGGKRLEFRFRKLSDPARERIERYLERSLAEEESGVGERTVRAPKRPSVKRFRILLLTEDNEYVKCLEPEFETEPFEFVVESRSEDFQEQTSRRGWNFIAVDGQIGYDKNELLADLRRSFRGRTKAPPPIVLLADDVARPLIEKARKWGFDHVFSRSIFGWTPVHEIGSVMGERNWIDTADMKRIAILIDDDRDATYDLEHALRCEDFTPLIFSKGSEGVRAVEAYQPEVVFIDTGLKNREGLDACRILKKMPSTKKIPVFVLTRDPDPGHKEAVLQTGVKAILTKPVDAFDLIRRVMGASSR